MMITRERISELYGILYHPLVKYSNRFLNDFEASEDIVQDAFTRLMEYSDRHAVEDTHLKAYLYKICRNLSLNYLKRRGHFTAVPLEVVDTAHHFVNIREPVYSENVTVTLEPFLGQLSPVHRSLFLMKLTERLKSSQMSEITGMSERTIRRRLQEVREHLKKVCCFQELSG